MSQGQQQGTAAFTAVITSRTAAPSEMTNNGQVAPIQLLKSVVPPEAGVRHTDHKPGKDVLTQDFKAVLGGVMGAADNSDLMTRVQARLNRCAYYNDAKW